MELTNKRVFYSVKNEDEFLKLDGEVQINNDTVLSNFSGSLTTLDGTPSGGFNYSEFDGLINKGVNSYPEELKDKGMNLLDATVDAIKLELSI